jgi:hypothetical protein
VKRIDDTVARYDPLEAVSQISEATGVDVKTVAQVLEGELDYMACLGLIDDSEIDDDARKEISELRGANADVIEASEGEYATEAAISFIQRNRGIDKQTITRVLDANYQFMEERGFLDEDWGEE